MALTEYLMTENGVKKADKVSMAIERLRAHEPPEGYYLAFSGGKDSIVIYDLAVKAGVNFDAHYHITTVDPPELVQFIRRYYPTVNRNLPEYSMYQLIAEVKMFPPLRQQRWCCGWLKEGGGVGRFVVTGVRRAKSAKRAGRRMVEQCQKGAGRILVSPIVDWSNEDIWEYIKARGLPYCGLYDEGWKRLGCVLCPMADQAEQAKRWPKIAEMYRRACIRAYDNAIASGKRRELKDGNELFEWWISGKSLPKESDQQVLFE